MDTNKLTRAHIRIRDERTKLTRAYETRDAELKAMQTRLEAAMLQTLNTSNSESIRTDAGTFYKQEEVIPVGNDWDAFYNWVAQHHAFDALERRIKKGFVKEYMETHEGGLPPGVSVLREYAVRVRRA